METTQVKKLKNFINGEWKEPSTEKSTKVYNPANSETLAEVPLSNARDVKAAAAAAVSAQKKWALVPAPQRAEVLYKTGLIMKEKKEHLGPPVDDGKWKSH